MAYATWNAGFEASPSGGDPGSVIDNKFNELKENIRRILHNAGIALPGTTPAADTPTDVGRHQVNAGGTGFSPHIYKSDGTTKLANVTDTGIDFPIAATGVNITSGSNPGHNHDVTLSFPLDLTQLDVFAFVRSFAFENRGNGVLTILEAKIVSCDPVDQTTEFNITRKLAGYTSAGNGGSAIATTPMLTIANTASVSNLLTSFTIPTLGVGEAWFISVNDLSPAPAWATLFLKLRRG